MDGFPNLKDDEYLGKLKQYIQSKEALVIFDGIIINGAMAFCRDSGSIDFLSVHPQYRKHDIARSFLKRLSYELLDEVPIYITTFREGDKADTGYRDTYKKLGFAEAELLTEFGYPTQKLILEKLYLKDNNSE